MPISGGDLIIVDAATWSLLYLGIAISEGSDWLGFKTTKSPVLFINPELQNFSFESRIQYLARNLTGQNCLENFHYITTHGKGLSSDKLLPILGKKIKAGQYGAIIMDSIYKFYPRDTEENSNSDVGRFLGKLEQLAVHSGAAIIYSHHYSKGNQASKAAIERSSGGGAWGRVKRILRFGLPPGCRHRNFIQVQLDRFISMSLLIIAQL